MTETEVQTTQDHIVVVGNEDTDTLYACFFVADDEDDARAQMVEKGLGEDEKITIVFPPKDLT